MKKSKLFVVGKWSDTPKPEDIIINIKKCVDQKYKIKTMKKVTLKQLKDISKKNVLDVRKAKDNLIIDYWN